MNNLFNLLKNMNGWKAVIAVVLSVGGSYLGIKEDLVSNRVQLNDFIKAQKDRDELQDTTNDRNYMLIHNDLNRLGDKIDESNRLAAGRAK